MEKKWRKMTKNKENCEKWQKWRKNNKNQEINGNHKILNCPGITDCILT